MLRFYRPSRQIPLWALILVVTAVVVNAFYIDARLHIGIDGIGTRLDAGNCKVLNIRSGSPAAKADINPGDILISIDSVKVHDDNHLLILERYRAGDMLDYTIGRSGKTFTIPVTLASFWSQHPAFYFILYFIIFLVSITSLFIIYKKPYDRSARLFFIYLVLFAIAQNSRFLFIDEPYATFASVLFILSFNLFGAFLLHFHLLFPTPSSIARKAGHFIPVIYAISALSGAILSYLIIMRNFSFSEEKEVIFGLGSSWSISWMGILLALALIAAIIQYVSLKDQQHRKQLRLVITGSVFGLITPIVFSINPEFFWKLETERHLLAIVEFTNAAGSYIMITFIGIAIFRYRIWEIETFIRRAVLYTLLTVLILLSYVFLINVLNLVAANLTPALHFTILGITLIIFLLLKDVIQYEVDRIFFREKYDAATVVGQFEEKLSGIYHEHELVREIRLSMSEIFHFEYFLFASEKNSHSYQIIDQAGISEAPEDKEIELSPETEVLLKRSVIISLDEIRNPPVLPGPAGGGLLVPVLDGNEPFGFFILGRKKSEKSYSLQDIKVLALLARRIAALFKTAALYKNDLDRQLMLERERTRIAEDMHDDVGASLSRISMLSEVARTNLEPNHRSGPFLEQISDTSREVIDEMNQIIWALNPKNDSLDGLLAFIRRFAMEFFESSPVRCSIEIPEKVPDIELSVEVRRNLYLVIREALHNAMKHAGASQVSIVLEIPEKGFAIRIKDNGRGFDADGLQYHGNGLFNMKKRINDIGGKIQVTSAPGKGTEINIFM